jgi:hypothetical protein
MADLPSYDFSDKKEPDKMKVNKENAEAIANHINSLI